MAFTEYTGDTTIIGALGTNPAERGLTTQEFKDKFDQFATEFVTWFNATHIAEADAHLAENAAKHIKESGSNANGKYIKFDDGTMICSKSLGTIESITPTTATEQSLTFYQHALNWTYPATFVGDYPAVSVSGRPGSSGGSLLVSSISTVINNSLTIAKLNYAGLANFTNIWGVSVIAVGRWKA